MNFLFAVWRQAKRGTDMGKSRILITDDEKDIRNMVKVMLEKEGFETVTAHNGKDAIE